MIAKDENWTYFAIFCVVICLIFPAALGIFIGAIGYMIFRYFILKAMG